METLILLAGAVVIIGLLATTLKKKDGPAAKDNGKDDITQWNDVTYTSVPIMTKTEIQFLALLYQAFPDYFIFPQVSTNAILKAASQNTSHYWKIRNKYDPTCIDYVICDPNFKIITLIELDDKTHDTKKEKDSERDFITGKAGYRTIRFDCRQMPSIEQIRTKLTA